MMKCSLQLLILKLWDYHILAVSALEDWEIEALDAKTAFLYGNLDEDPITNDLPDANRPKR